MSWPADGKPRFIVVEVTGALKPSGRAVAHENVTVSILDRAFCHREVAKFRSETYIGLKRPGLKARALARAKAQTKLAALEATYALEQAA